MTVRDRIGRASLDAIPAENAARIVDVVDFRVPLARRNSIRVRVFRRLDVNAIRRASGSAQKAGNTFFEAVFIALQNVNAAKSLLKPGTLQGPGTVGIVLDDGRLKHLPEGDTHAFGDGGDVLENRHYY